jgi:hypothetical protein
MSGSAIAAIVAFVVLFTAWVVLPSILKKRHAAKMGDEKESED